MAQTQKRQDPPRRVLSVLQHNALTRRDPDKDYVWAYMGHQESGVGLYESLGYNPVLWTKDGVRPAAKRKVTEDLEGTPITWNGHMLMECDLALRKQRDYEGDDGESGQRRADELEKQLSSERGAVDVMQGMRGARQWMRVQNETSKAVIDREAR